MNTDDTTSSVVKKRIPLSVKVSKSSGIKESDGWSYSEWENAGNSSNNFRGFSLYVIECISKTERFIKVGKTFNDIGIRFRELPYKFKVHTLVYHNAYAISKLEEKIHRELKNSSYTPTKQFEGSTECYCLSVIEEAIFIAEDGYREG